MTHTLITKDGYELTVGTKIYYTGDQANIPGNMTINKIYTDRWGTHIVLIEAIGGEDRTMNISISGLEPGAGRRFLPMALRLKEREEGLNQLRDYLASRKVTPVITEAQTVKQSGRF